MRNPSSVNSLRVLVVDDSDAQRRFYRAVLEASGIGVAEAADGQIALRLMQTEVFDVVVLDLNMPVLGGLDVLRRSSRANRPPIIVSSSDANTMAADYPREFESVSFILQKPVEPAEFLNAISLALQTSSLRRTSHR